MKHLLLTLTESIGPPDIVSWIAIVATIITWARSESKTNTIAEINDRNVIELTNKINRMNEELATSTEDRKHLTNQIQRLEELKANRETVDSFRSDLHNLRADMDKRFDRIENILEGIRTK